MANKFKQLAQQATSQSKLQIGREQIKTKDLLSDSETTYTIVAVDRIPSRDKKSNTIITDENGVVVTHGVCVFKELPDRYYNCGSVLSKIIDTWVDSYDGDAEKCSVDLEADGGVEVSLYLKMNGSGNEYVAVTII